MARLFDAHWNLVVTAARQTVAYGLEHRELGGALYIGIDELSRRKGHVSATNVYNRKEKRLQWTGKGRRAVSLFKHTFGKREYADCGALSSGTAH